MKEKGDSVGGRGERGGEVQKPTVMVPVQRERGKEGGTGKKRKREERSEGCWDSELASNGV